MGHALARILGTCAIALLVLLAGCGAKPAASSSARPADTATSHPATTSPGPLQPTATVIITQPPTTVTQAGPTQTVTAQPTAVPPPPPPPAGGPAGQAPLLTDVSAGADSPTTAHVRWTVEDDFDGVVSHVAFGTHQVTDQNSPIQTGNGTFTAALVGLSSCTVYSYDVTATDVGGLTAHSTGSFQTPPGPAPNGTGPFLVSAMHNSLNVSYTAVGAADAQSYIEYGTTTAYGQRSATQAGPGNFTVQLTGLQSAKAYHARFRVQTPCTTFLGTDHVFTTATLVAVDITGSNGGVSFVPAGQSAGAVAAPKNSPFVFQVHNKDATKPHDLSIKGQSYGSNAIAPGATVTLSPALVLAAGTYTLYDSIDNPSGSALGTSGTLSVN